MKIVQIVLLIVLSPLFIIGYVYGLAEFIFVTGKLTDGEFFNRTISEACRKYMNRK